MKNIIIKKDNSSRKFLYEQLYSNIKQQIQSGEMFPGEKCPSIRNLSVSTGVSVTTVMEAYGQLLAEGFIRNKPGSGYYVENIGVADKTTYNTISKELDLDSFSHPNGDVIPYEFLLDKDSFDFNRWKKCASKVYTEYSDSLLYESEMKGEYSLRKELSKYLSQSRGVSTSPDNIVIAAGTQQIVFHLGRILKAMSINLISVENPGYKPVKSMFTDALFTTVDIPIMSDGISIELLPVNISSAVYVNPSNQFPTGVVMSAPKRYEILKWAENNNSYIIEDDYNSELRYIGKPLPTIKSLDSSDRVIYLGSFSSTLFSAIKISYMVLPDKLAKIFDEIKNNYSQTCSKAEQLTLAYYMMEGHYYTAIKKKRALYSKKLLEVTSAFNWYADEKIVLENTNSGLTVNVCITSDIDGKLFEKEAEKLKIHAVYIKEISDNNHQRLMLYYSFIPLSDMEKSINNLIDVWNNLL